MEALKIDFNPDLFNEVYWELEAAFTNPELRYIWLYGGSSASKTFSVVQLVVKEMLAGSDFNTMVMRKVSNDIKDSIYADFKGIINDWGLQDLFIIQQNFIKCITGSYVRFRGLDDSEKVKGISRFKKVILEEINQFDEVDFKQVRKRLRGATGQQIIGIFNPIREDHWIKTNVFDKETWVECETKITSKKLNEKGNSLILLTNYTDNVYIVGRWKEGEDGRRVQVGGFVDQHVIDDFENDRINDYAYYEVYALGKWGQLLTGGEFYKKFKKEKHVSKLSYIPNLPLHISFDENVNPYLPAGIFQIQGKKIMLIAEVLGRNPNNTIKWNCQEITRLCHAWGHTAGMFIYGDATSQKEDVKVEKGYDLFRLIMENLSQFKPSRRVAPSNPSITMRGNFINAILQENYAGIEFVINESCPESINDFYCTKEAADGRKDKTKVKDKITGVSYQPYGHITDLTDYLICFAFQKEYADYQRGGKAMAITTGKAQSKNTY